VDSSRGDEMGEYDLSADFEGTLMPFRETVTARFETDEPLIVNGSRGLILYLYPSIGAISGQEYRVGFRLANESEVTFNMARLGFNDSESNVQPFEFNLVGDVPNGKELRDGESILVRELFPGESIEGTYVTIFPEDMNQEQLYFLLSRMFGVAVGRLPMVITWQEPEEESIPDNEGNLAWPTTSMEVTLWYGQLDHISNVRSDGLNIQDRADSVVFAVANGIIADIVDDRVYVDFKLNGELMQAMYGNIRLDDRLSVGDRVRRGNVIGQMNEHSIEVVFDNLDITIAHALLELEIRVNDQPINPVTLFDLSGMTSEFLHNSMINFFDRNAQLEGANPTEADIRYALNLDLNEGEMYLRRYIEMLFYGSDLPGQGLTINDVLIWNPDTGVVTVRYLFGDDFFFVPMEMYEEMQEQAFGRGRASIAGFSAANAPNAPNVNNSMPIGDLRNNRTIIRFNFPAMLSTRGLYERTVTIEGLTLQGTTTNRIICVISGRIYLLDNYARRYGYTVGSTRIGFQNIATLTRGESGVSEYATFITNDEVEFRVPVERIRQGAGYVPHVNINGTLHNFNEFARDGGFRRNPVTVYEMSGGIEHYFSREVGAVEVTVAMMNEFGWRREQGGTDAAEVERINNLLRDPRINININTWESLRLFMATVAHESGFGRSSIEDYGGNLSYFDEKTYDLFTRGAGYIQITQTNRHNNHDRFLEWIGSDVRSAPNVNTAEYIANNFAWEASFWFWAVDRRTREGNLNYYVARFGDSEGVYLVTQFFVNGWPRFADDRRDARGYRLLISQDLAEVIRDGTRRVDWDINPGNIIDDRGNEVVASVLSVGGERFVAPRGWDTEITGREATFILAGEHFRASNRGSGGSGGGYDE